MPRTAAVDLLPVAADPVEKHPHGSRLHLLLLGVGLVALLWAALVALATNASADELPPGWTASAGTGRPAEPPARGGPVTTVAVPGTTVTVGTVGTVGTTTVVDPNDGPEAPGDDGSAAGAPAPPDPEPVFELPDLDLPGIGGTDTGGLTPTTPDGTGALPDVTTPDTTTDTAIPDTAIPDTTTTDTTTPGAATPGGTSTTDTTTTDPTTTDTTTPDATSPETTLPDDAAADAGTDSTAADSAATGAASTGAAASTGPAAPNVAPNTFGSPDQVTAPPGPFVPRPTWPVVRSRARVLEAGAVASGTLTGSAGLAGASSPERGAATAQPAGTLHAVTDPEAPVPGQHPGAPPVTGTVTGCGTGAPSGPDRAGGTQLPLSTPSSGGSGRPGLASLVPCPAAAPAVLDRAVDPGSSPG